MKQTKEDTTAEEDGWCKYCKVGTEESGQSICSDCETIEKESIRMTINMFEKKIDEEINWYDSFGKNGETDREIIQQASAITNELKELKKWLGEGEEK